MTEVRDSDKALNRALWAVMNERFTDAAADELWVRPDAVWGLFAVPERDLGVLGPVHGLDVVELACGTAYFSAWLARAGAMTVAVDLAHEQLTTARRMQTPGRTGIPLVQGDGERVPLASGRYDLVVSEHGAAAWCDPERWLPEAARLLRPGGRLVFLTNSHLSALCVPADEGVAGERLLRGSVRPTRCAGPAEGSSSIPRTGTGCGCFAGLASWSWPCTRSMRRRRATTTPSTRSCRRTGRPGGPPRSSGWRCVRDDGAM